VPDEYTLKVEYTKGGTTDTDTYETIYVFEADLDIADVADADELNPGGFLAYNDDDDDNDGSVRPCRNPSGFLVGRTLREVWRAAAGPPRGDSGRTRREGAFWNARGATPLWKHCALEVRTDL